MTSQGNGIVLPRHRRLMKAASPAPQPVQEQEPVGDGVQSGWDKLLQRQGEILRDYALGNLTRLGVANYLRREGFNSTHATDTANGLPASPPEQELRAKVESSCCIEDIAVGGEPCGPFCDLQAEVERLTEALKPFADVADHDIGEDEADTDTFQPMTNYNSAAKITVGDMRRARAALGGTP